MCLDNYGPHYFEAIEMEIETPSLQMSGEDSNRQDY